MNKKAINIVMVGLLFCILTIIFLTRPAILECLNLANESNSYIGSTIGGITAPIVGLLTAYLLYITFASQKKANDELIKINRIKDLNDSLQNLESFMLSSKTLDYWESVEIELNCKSINSKENPNILSLTEKQFYPVLHISNQILILVNQIDKIDKEDSENLRLRILSIIKLVKSTHAYKSILKSGAINQQGNNYIEPEDNINAASKITDKWGIELPKMKFSSKQEVMEAFAKEE
jgi:hypothetical protein